MREARPQDLEEWLFFLENRHVQEIQPGLQRIHSVAEELDLLHHDARVISVAGTNGKGSTVALLESVYCAAGYAVASYTSPHVLKFNERIRVNKTAIGDDELLAAFEAVEKSAGFASLTYFEVTTLAALWHFRQHTPAIIILEVGMGGRLDATNIIDCDLAIITTIAMDHEAWLGNSLEAIGYEKAGILRENTAFIYADQFMPQSIQAQAERLNAPVYHQGNDYRYDLADGKMRFCFQDRVMDLPASGCHPNSVAAAVMATICLQGDLPVRYEEICDGISQVRVTGRLQQVDTGSAPILLDVAHNPQAVSWLAEQVAKQYPQRRIHAVFSAMADKDITGLIAPLRDMVAHWYPARQPGKRAASAEQLLAALKDHDIEQNLCYNEPFLAYQAACARTHKDDLILVFGSFVIVGMVLTALSGIQGE